MTDYDITLKPFASAVDGHPMLQASIGIAGGDDYVTHYLRDHGFDVDTIGAGENDDVVLSEAMRGATELMIVALGAVRDTVDIEGLNGDAIFDADLDWVRPTWRGGAKVRVAITVVDTAPPQAKPARVYATDRAESDACQAGTPGCSIDHSVDDNGCDSW